MDESAVFFLAMHNYNTLRTYGDYIMNSMFQKVP